MMVGACVQSTVLTAKQEHYRQMGVCFRMDPFFFKCCRCEMSREDFLSKEI